MEKQTESSMMPPYIIGILYKDTPTHYVLTRVLEQNEETFELREREGFDFINKTYVWRCEVLGEERPYDVTEDDGYEGGGLG